MIYFTSDNHFFHRNIIEYSNRPFRDVDHMNETMISNWNTLVQPTDTIYCLGDFGFSRVDKLQRLFDRLVGQKHLILGNHDKESRKLSGWASVGHYIELRIDGKFIVLFHYAPRVWNRCHHGSICLYGHSHGSMPGNSQSLDVGVDCWDYRPVTLRDIEHRLKTLPKFTGYSQQAGGSDHHTIRVVDEGQKELEKRTGNL